MSSRYVVEVVFTLKPMAAPRLTLMSVAKPWMVELPDPVMSHWLRGVPGFVFSQAISFTTGASQGAAAAGGAGGARGRGEGPPPARPPSPRRPRQTPPRAA